MRIDLLFYLLVLIFALCSKPVLGNTLIVGNKYEGTVSFIDLASGRELVRSETGGSPHELALAPDGATVVVVSYLEDGYIGEELNVFDVATGKRISTISISPHQAPHGIQWLGSGDQVIVTTEQSRDVVRVDVVKAEVTAVARTDQLGSHLLALSPDGRRAYVTSRGSDTFSVIDTQTMVLSSTEPAGKGPEAVWVSPDGRELWIGNNESKDIYIFDVATLRRKEIIDVGFLPIRLRFHPAGDLVAVADLRGDRIVILDARSRRQLATIDVAAVGAREPASLYFSADGNYLYAGAQRGARVVEIDVAQWSITRVFEVGDGADGIEFSPVKLELSTALEAQENRVQEAEHE